ncbi:MAG: hypothetical protein HRU19_22260 [Pseudobacteriovorax sp.]|nr:hypothetical protein [Pseudobacteriovorax sp.]
MKNLTVSFLGAIVILWSFGGDMMAAESRYQREVLGVNVNLNINIEADGSRTFLLDAPGSLSPSLKWRQDNEELRLQSSSPWLDAYFAMAVYEARLNATDKIRDNSYNFGNDLDCNCYVTGELWPFVWTRDTAFALDLGLSWLDADRGKNSLSFKTSPFRLQTGNQQTHEIIQDTGTDGSWPVSSDRVSWTVGAKAVSPQLNPGADRGFHAFSIDTVLATVLKDRGIVFDSQWGLYRGEQSFLDWREQSYHLSTRGDVTPIAQGFALSTNLLHLQALEYLAKELMTSRREEIGTKIQKYALDLREAIQQRFWNSRTNTYASYLWQSSGLTPSGHTDLLALSLMAELFPGDQRLKKQFATYPMASSGAPVYFPFSFDVPIYHNQAYWPFVGGYALRASGLLGLSEHHGLHLDHLIQASLRWGTHIENLESLSALPRYNDGDRTGPVVNSKRQLWSVGAALGSVIEQLFGLKAKDLESWWISPNISVDWAKSWLGTNGQTLTLSNLSFKSSKTQVTLVLPELDESTASGFLELKAVVIGESSLPIEDGKAIVTWDDILNAPANQNKEIKIVMGVKQVEESSQQASPLIIPGKPQSELSLDEITAIFSPAQATLSVIRNDGIDTLSIAPASPWARFGNVEFIITDGYTEIVKPDTTVPLVELGALNDCLVVIVRDRSTKLESHPTPPLCSYRSQYWISPREMITESGQAPVVTFEHGKNHVRDWGRPEQTLCGALKVRDNGSYKIQLEYGNAHTNITTGMTSTNKIMTLESNSQTTQELALVSPSRPTWQDWGLSTSQTVELLAGQTYRWCLKDANNMTYLAAAASYTGNPGGFEGPLNRLNLSGILIRRLTD